MDTSVIAEKGVLLGINGCKQNWFVRYFFGKSALTLSALRLFRALKCVKVCLWLGLNLTAGDPWVI